jgi:hypothetical protein
MDYGEILDEALQLYKNNAALVIAIAATVYVPLALLQLIWALTMTSPQPGSMPNPAMLASTGLLGFLFLFAALFMSGAMTKAVADRYLDTPSSVGSAYGFVLRRAWPYLGTIIMCGLLVTAGFFLLIVGAVIFAFWTAFATIVFVVEGKADAAAIARSRQLAAGNWGRIFVVGLIIALMTWIAQAILQLPFTWGLAAAMGAKGATVGSALGSAISSVVVAPFSTIIMVLLYFDIRVRQEGFDLELLAQSLGGKPPPVPLPGTVLPAPGAPSPPAPEVAAAPGAPPPPAASAIELPPQAWGSPPVPPAEADTKPPEAGS